jgi:hypothetical protein
MERIRNGLSTVLVAIAVLIASFWLLRQVFGFVRFVLGTVLLLVVVVGLLVLAGRVRRR